jgi:small subunit ribosomal protein S2
MSEENTPQQEEQATSAPPADATPAAAPDESAPAQAAPAVKVEAKPTREMVRELIDAGIHFGHRASRWNPKMAPYIYGRRNKIHIIDVRETLKGLLRAKKFVAQVVAGGEDVVFVGTKRQARLTIKAEAERCGMPYVGERWLGGTLTNFRTIRSRLSRLEELEGLEESGQMDQLSKKEISSLRREKRKILRNLGGIRNMNRLPGVMVVVDVRRENIAVKEAQKVGVGTVALIDTDSDPDFVDLPIPGNDDAMRGIELVVTELADAVLAGKANRAAAQDEAAKSGEGAGQRRRRRSRRSTSQQFEEQMTPTEQKIHAAAPSVLEVAPDADVAEEVREKSDLPETASEDQPIAESLSNKPAEEGGGGEQSADPDAATSESTEEPTEQDKQS